MSGAGHCSPGEHGVINSYLPLKSGPGLDIRADHVTSSAITYLVSIYMFDHDLFDLIELP